MTLRQKTLLIISVTLLCFLIALYLSLSSIWLNGFAKIESQQTHQNVERVTQAIENELVELNTTAGNWTQSDDIYAFVEHGTNNDVQANVNDALLNTLRLNVLLFISTTGRISYGKGFDLQRKLAVPVPNSLSQYLATNSRLLQYSQANRSHTGIVLLPEGALLIAAQPISGSKRNASNRGTLLLGRFLNAAEVKRLSGLIHLPFIIYPFPDAQGDRPALLQADRNLQTISNEFSRELSNPKTQVQLPILIRSLGAERIAGYGLLKDIQGQPGLLLRVDATKDVYQQGKDGLRYLLAAILAVSLVFGFVNLLLLEKVVLLPLKRFSTVVRRISATGDFSRRLLSSGKDELSALASTINQLLASLQQFQRQLGQTQQQYQSVVENAKEVIFQTDNQGIWTLLNPAWTEITKFYLEESLGQPCWQFIHPEDQAYYWQQFHRLMEGEVQDTCYEIRYITQEGGYRWFEVHCRLTFTRRGAIAGTAGTLNDITKRKIAEAALQQAKAQLEAHVEQRTAQLQQVNAQLMSEVQQRQQAATALKKSEKLLRRVLEALPVGVWVVDREGQVVLANPATEKIWAGSKFTCLQPFQDDVEGGTAHLVETDRAATPISLTRVLTKGEASMNEVINVQCFDGSQKILLHSAVPIWDSRQQVEGAIAVHQDITARQLAEAALRNSEARERAKAQELEQILRELTRTQAQLIQSEKMSSLGQLVAGIAHEINNPTNFISGNIDHANEYIQDLLHLINCYQQHYPNPLIAIQDEMEAIDFDFLVDDLPKLLDSIKLGAQRIQQIVQSLRKFSRLDESEIKAADIHEGIDCTLLILQNRLKAKPGKAKIQVMKDYGELPLVKCYPGLLNQVLMHLITNAIDALEEKQIQSDSENSSFSPFIQICTEVKQGDLLSDDSYASHIVIRIIDNGMGMNKEVRRRLFDPFFTTKPVGKGTGLGLSISHQIIVETHKGQLLVNSELDQGTEFIIELPFQQQQ